MVAILSEKDKQLVAKDEQLTVKDKQVATILTTIDKLHSIIKDRLNPHATDVAMAV